MPPIINAASRPPRRRSWTTSELPNGARYTDLRSFDRQFERRIGELDDIDERTTRHWRDLLSQREELDLPSIWSERMSRAMHERREALRLRMRLRIGTEEHIEDLRMSAIEEDRTGDHHPSNHHATDYFYKSEPTDQREIIWFRCGSGEPECQAATGGLVGALRTQYSEMLQRKIALCCTACQWELNERVPEVKVMYNGGEFSGQANDTNHFKMLMEKRQRQTSDSYWLKSDSSYEKSLVDIQSGNDAKSVSLSLEDWLDIRISYQELMESLEFPESPGSERDSWRILSG